MNKSIRLINDNYISPEKAAHKLRAARKFHTPLYLYGVTGIGKTSLVMNTLNMRRCTYYSAAETIAEKLELKEWEGEHTVVIDDLHCVTDSDQRELFREDQEITGSGKYLAYLDRQMPFSQMAFGDSDQIYICRNSGRGLLSDFGRTEALYGTGRASVV